jgi:phosphatidylglycerophosphatase A
MKPLSRQERQAYGLNIRGPADWLAVVIATGLGVGFAPFAPGTFGSLLGVAIFYGLMAAFRTNPHLLQNSLLTLGAILTALGIWAASRVEKILDKKDAGQIVIDEVCGQLVSFAFVAVYLTNTDAHPLWMLATGFVLFRLFDIFKPYPIRRLEALGSGLGVMADDMLAGIYAAIVLSLLILFFFPLYIA